jgi:hypothetical protein
MRVSAFVLAACALCAQAPPVPPKHQLAGEDRESIKAKTAELERALKPLRGRVADDLLVDAEVYLKAAQWVVRFDEFYSKADGEHALAVLDTGLHRANQLARSEPAWTKKTGSFCRAYRSRVDGSVQPYAVTIPENYSARTPEWLEVVLHGRGATLTEASFLYEHDRTTPQPADHQFMRLDVFGRGNNAYRWAGETDVFEAIESVKKRYAIDPTHIVLRGFSMGGAGAWHLGLHYPDRWAAVEAGAGFVETKVHGGVENPPPYTRIYDALDYALNAVNVPIVGYGGEDDPQLRASVFIRKQLEREGYHFQPGEYEFTTEDLRALFLIGPKTQHRWEPASKKKSDTFMLLNQSPGVLEQSPKHFVTYTERYNKLFWITIDQLERQYERAQVDTDDKEFDVVIDTRNVARLTVKGEPPSNRFVVDGQAFPIAPVATFEKVNGRWRLARSNAGLRKRHGLQGPIDDAFMEPFLCVRPTKADSPVAAFATRELDRFAAEFARWMRGDVRMKSVDKVAPADARAYSMVIFGTPETNPMVARALRSAPIQWTADAIVVGKRRFDPKTHILSMIYPNPDNPTRYVVINSGHTFHEAEFKDTNALLYPHAGDWAVTDISTGSIVAEGVFNKDWRLTGE